MTLTIHLKVTTNPLPKGSSTVLRKTGTRGEELWSKTGFSHSTTYVKYKKRKDKKIHDLDKYFTHRLLL